MATRIKQAAHNVGAGRVNKDNRLGVLDATGGAYASGFYTGKDGVMRYVDFNIPDETFYAYLTGTKVMDDLGIPTPDMWYVVANEEDRKNGLARRVVNDNGNLGSNLNSRTSASVLRGFAVDYLTGNNITGSNVVFGGRGNPIRINSGTFTTSNRGNWSNLSPTQRQLFSQMGITSPSQIPGIRNQITNIVQLRNRYGGWYNYLNSRGPTGIPDTEKRRIARVLEARTTYLEGQLRSL